MPNWHQPMPLSWAELYQLKKYLKEEETPQPRVYSACKIAVHSQVPQLPTAEGAKHNHVAPEQWQLRQKKCLLPSWYRNYSEPELVDKDLQTGFALVNPHCVYSPPG